MEWTRKIQRQIDRLIDSQQNMYQIEQVNKVDLTGESQHGFKKGTYGKDFMSLGLPP